MWPNRAAPDIPTPSRDICAVALSQVAGIVMGGVTFGPSTFGGQRSIQLSYGCAGPFAPNDAVEGFV